MKYAADNIKGEWLRTFYDAKSGNRLDRLEGLKKMVEKLDARAAAGIQTILVISDVSRLVRDAEHSFSKFQHLGSVSTIHSIADRLVTGVRSPDETSYLQGMGLVSKAVNFSVNMSEKVRMAHQRKVERGEETHTVNIPFGFKAVRAGSKRYLIQNRSTFNQAKRLAHSKWSNRCSMTKTQHKKRAGLVQKSRPGKGSRKVHKAPNQSVRGVVRREERQE